MFKLRKIHKWLALIVGVQILLWGISGLYMTIVDIDIIHGDHLVKDISPSIISSESINPIPQSILDEFNDEDKNKALTNISLRNIAGTAYYQLRARRKSILIEAISGKKPSEISKLEIETQVKQFYAGDAELKSLELLNRYPSEIGGRKRTVWQAQFDDSFNSTLYFDSSTGRLISKRTDLWRTFDFLWMLHIMDYRSREDIENNIFRLFAVLSLVFTFIGWLLLYLRLNNPTRMTIAMKAKEDSPSKWLLIIRKTHRWIAVLVSIQLFLWIAGGVTFTFMDMREAGGNFIYKNTPKDVISSVIDHKTILESYPKATKITQYSQLGKTFAKIFFNQQSVILNQSFEVVEKLTKEQIKLVAMSRYAGKGEILAIDKMTDHTDENYQFSLPHWRLTFDDEYYSRIYLSEDTGQFLATRTDTWKIFDFFMMVHFMDYWERGDFNNGLVIFFALVLVFFSLSGLLLLNQSFSKNDFLRIINKILYKKKIALEIRLGNGKIEHVEVSKYEILFDTLKRLNYRPKSQCGGASECRQCWVKQKNNNSGKTTIILSCQTIVTKDLAIELK
ncbi:MAG: hypothetical protein COA86_06730 [Kangiella sp.]|nr:MAG: hypothetical protein COA86_06730 [Kangiella sp.]